MANLKTDSPLSRRIVVSFIDFLNSVEAGPDVDIEGLGVAKDCLVDVFKIDPLIDRPPKRDSLVEIFSSEECVKQGETKLDSSSDCISADASSTSSGQHVADAKQAVPPEFQDKDWTGENHVQGIPKDELFGKLFEGLEKVHYFKTLPDGNDDQDQLDRVTRIFHNAIQEIEKSGCQTFDRKNLADNLKSQGNKAMQSKLFTDAIELYTFAIALSDDVAVFFCNRAAAYTQVSQYDEAIRDSLKSIEIDPRYGKAYSRLGFAYYSQGKYKDAIDKGFIQAQKLDPSNESIRENIRAAQEKLNEEYLQSMQHNQNSSSSSHQGNSNQQSAGGSRSRAMPPQFTSFTGNGLPAELTNMLRNFSANVMYEDDLQGVGNSVEPFPDPEIRIGGGNINVNLGDQMPSDLSGALRSVMEVFSGSAPHDNSQENLNGGRSAPS